MVRGCLYPSAWLEKYKAEHKVQMQKSKGMNLALHHKDVHNLVHILIVIIIIIMI